MEYLQSNIEVVGLHQLLHSGVSSRPLCTITFDDGYAGVYENAFPILTRYGFTAAVYLTSDALAESRNCLSSADLGLVPGLRMLSWPQVRELQRHGFIIGSHLSSHCDLSRLSQAEADRQLKSSKQTIEDRLGEPCYDLAYPFGRFSRANLASVAGSGYKTAVTTRQKPLPGRVDPLRIPRFDVCSDFDLADFRALLDGDFDYLAIAQTLRNSLSLALFQPGAPRH
jgi:peptidoglycan/xylan/chitin deacetylase (PgdA/CDA1 family)